MSIEDKYYPRSEFHNLTDAQKKGLLIKRKQRNTGGKKPKDKGAGKKGGKDGKDLKRARRQIAKLERQIAALNVGDDDDGSGSDSESEQRAKKKPKGNRDHPNLNRRDRP